MPTLAARLRGDEVVITGWSGIPDALTVEVMAAQAYDAITLDMQHGGHHEDSVVRSIPAIRNAGRHAVVRVPVGRWDMASRALDFGAEAVIAPMVNSVADAQSFAAAAKYPPLGQRSWGPTFALPRLRMTAASYLPEANAETVSFAMIETQAALEALDGILATPGIDAVFVGPSDFSIAWTNGAKLDPTLEDMMTAVADIATRARAAGKFAGIYITEPSMMGRFVAMGFRFFALGNEQNLMKLGADALLASAKSSL